MIFAACNSICRTWFIQPMCTRIGQPTNGTNDLGIRATPTRCSSGSGAVEIQTSIGVPVSHLSSKQDLAAGPPGAGSITRAWSGTHGTATTHQQALENSSARSCSDRKRENRTPPCDPMGNRSIRSAVLSYLSLVLPKEPSYLHRGNHNPVHLSIRTRPKVGRRIENRFRDQSSFRISPARLSSTANAVSKNLLQKRAAVA